MTPYDGKAGAASLRRQHEAVVPPPSCRILFPVTTMTSKRRALASALWMTAVTILAAPGQGAPSAPGVALEPVDWPAFMAAHDMSFDRLPRKWTEAPHFGNAAIGSMLYQEGNTIKLQVFRNDVHDHRDDTWGWPAYSRPRLRIGHFSLEPVGKLTGCQWRKDLWNAELTGTITTDKGEIRIRHFTHAEDMAIVTELTPSAGEQACKWTWHPMEAKTSRPGYPTQPVGGRGLRQEVRRPLRRHPETLEAQPRRTPGGAGRASRCGSRTSSSAASMRPPGASRPQGHPHPRRQHRQQLSGIHRRRHRRGRRGALPRASTAGAWVQCPPRLVARLLCPELCHHPRQEPRVALLADDLPLRLHQPDRPLLRRHPGHLVPGRPVGLHHHQLEHPERPLAGLHREPARAGPGTPRPASHGTARPWSRRCGPVEWQDDSAYLPTRSPATWPATASRTCATTTRSATCPGP